MTKKKQETRKSRTEKTLEWMKVNGYEWTVVERFGFKWWNLFDCRNPNLIKFVRTFRKVFDMVDWVIANLVGELESRPPGNEPDIVFDANLDREIKYPRHDGD